MRCCAGWNVIVTLPSRNRRQTGSSSSGCYCPRCSGKLWPQFYCTVLSSPYIWLQGGRNGRVCKSSGRRRVSRAVCLLYVRLQFGLGLFNRFRMTPLRSACVTLPYRRDGNCTHDKDKPHPNASQNPIFPHRTVSCFRIVLFVWNLILHNPLHFGSKARYTQTRSETKLTSTVSCRSSFLCIG